MDLSQTDFREYTPEEILNNKYPIPEIFDHWDPMIRYIKGIPEHSLFGDLFTVEQRTSNSIYNSNTVLFKKMYVAITFEYMLNYARTSRVFSKKQKSVIQKLEVINKTLKDQYEEARNGVASNAEIILTVKISEARLMSLLNVDFGLLTYIPSRNHYSTQDKIKFASYFFIALGILGTVATATLAILLSQKVMELSLKSAAFLVPAIASLTILLIATIVALVIKRSQKQEQNFEAKPMQGLVYNDPTWS
ncbi:MAG: hypothetical protein LBJ93_02285 [Clostridiales bacterium]|nr:hypothetical protein [Clostridiales bacterium]